eukprot:COSAG01_NODE_49832_length_368_cov_3.390335_1_plen_85_part_01
MILPGTTVLYYGTVLQSYLSVHTVPSRTLLDREAATAELLDGDVSALGVEGRQRAILRRSLLEQELALALARQHALHGPVFVFQD